MNHIDIWGKKVPRRGKNKGTICYQSLPGIWEERPAKLRAIADEEKLRYQASGSREVR